MSCDSGGMVCDMRWDGPLVVVGSSRLSGPEPTCCVTSFFSLKDGLGGKVGQGRHDYLRTGVESLRRPDSCRL